MTNPCVIECFKKQRICFIPVQCLSYGSCINCETLFTAREMPRRVIARFSKNLLYYDIEYD
jgi:hypothetical protein